MQPSKPSPFPWARPWDFADAAKEREAKNGFQPSRAAERAYERQLKSVAGQIKTILAASVPGDAEALLKKYAEVLEPWARQSAANMMAGAQKKNLQTWKAAANRAGLDMRVLLNSPGVGAAVRAAVDNNIKLIKSLALGAAEQVGQITAGSLATGSRAEDIAKRIEAIGEVSESRARTIARTEVSKAGTALTQVRAASVGSSGYIWRTARDGDTRPSHRAMEGKFVAWDDMPVLDNMKGHAGEFPNCRCYPEPVIPRDDGGVYKPPLPTQGEERNAGEKRMLSQWEKTEGSETIPHMPGTPLVNADRAILDTKGKLAAYLLNPDHKKGKAALLQSAIGATQKDTLNIHDQILSVIGVAEATPRKSDKYGEKFNVNVPIKGPNGKTIDVITAWIYDRNNGAVSLKPRLVTVNIPKDRIAYYADERVQ